MENAVAWIRFQQTFGRGSTRGQDLLAALTPFASPAGVIAQSPFLDIAYEQARGFAFSKPLAAEAPGARTSGPAWGTPAPFLECPGTPWGGKNGLRG